MISTNRSKTVFSDKTAGIFVDDKNRPVESVEPDSIDGLGTDTLDSQQIFWRRWGIN